MPGEQAGPGVQVRLNLPVAFHTCQEGNCEGKRVHTVRIEAATRKPREAP